jgi:hypothetical protein
MAVTDEKDGALATAAVAAAAGAAAYGLKKAFSGGGSGVPGSALLRSDDGDEDDEESGGSRGALLQTVWDSASDTLLPHAEDAAEAAGKWVAENAPDVIRERLLPRFIEAFTDAA